MPENRIDPLFNSEGLFNPKGQIIIQPEITIGPEDVARSCPFCGHRRYLTDWFTEWEEWTDHDPVTLPYKRSGGSYLYRCERGHPFAWLIGHDGKPWIRLVVPASEYAPQSVSRR